MIKAIAIDLDDTLIDTSGQLVPLASRKACAEMISQGLACSLADCVAWRTQLAVEHTHRELFTLIARKFGPQEQAETLGRAGAQVFYNHTDIPDPLALLPDADEVLTQLSAQARLFLVTAGAENTQRRKIAAARLEKRFEKIYIIDKFKNQSKQTAFEDILANLQIQPEELLSVGNRLKEEIRLAKILGAQTCYFEFGEHVGESAEQPEDHPDFRVQHWRDFVTACRL